MNTQLNVSSHSASIRKGDRRTNIFRISALLVLALAGSARAENDLMPIGGAGGGGFRVRCVAPAVLTGIEVRSGDYVDALRPLCVAPSISSQRFEPDDDAWQGGFGGGLRRVVCPASTPMVWGIYVGVDQDEAVVNDLLLYCNNTPGTAAGVSVSLKPGEAYATHDDTQGCGRGQVAVGLHGRSGKYIDALGLICASAPSAVSGLGKKINTAPANSRPAGWTICDSARDARARNSPAAPNLEAQCRNFKPPVTGPGKSIPAPASASPPPTTPTPATTPQPPSITPSTKQDVRNAAMQDLAGAIISTIQDARANRNPVNASTTGRIEGSNDRRRGDSIPRDAQASAGVEQEGSAHESARRYGSIRIQVRYPQSYGYKEAASQLDASPNSCGAFYISAHSAADVRPRGPTRIDTQPGMRRVDGMYVCDYLIYDQAIGASVELRVAMSDQRAAGSAAWLGGSQPQPPAGARRMIVDANRQVVLTVDRPSTTLVFEMAYAGAP